MEKAIITLNNLINSSGDPGNGREIPWSNPDFSKRILRDQLNPDTDIASRRPAATNKLVQFIHHHLLGNKTTTILDLGCGPGLYSHGLAEFGHRCTGVDKSPAAIEYANHIATEKNLNCNFIQANFIESELDNGYGFAMLTFGDFNSLLRKDGKTLIQKVFHSLNPGGIFLLEGLTIESVREIGEREPGWLIFESGMFSDKPYLYLDKYVFNEAENSASAHYFILNSAGVIDHYRQNYIGYSDDEYQHLLLDAGFESVEFYRDFAPGSHDFADDLQMIVARK